MTSTETRDDAVAQAKAQVASIVEAHKAYMELDEGDAVSVEFDGATFDHSDDVADAARDNLPLSVETRSAWHGVGVKLEAAEWRILLCTGGPHVELRGDLDSHGEAAGATIYASGWFIELEPVHVFGDDQAALNWFANLFYYSYE